MATPRFSRDRWPTPCSEIRPRSSRAGDTPPSIDRLSMNEVTTYRWEFDEDLHHYRQAGFTGVGVWLRKLQDFGEERGLELLRDSGLVVSNVVWAGGFTGSDGVSSEESLDRTSHALRLAGAMRAGSLTVFTGGRNRHTWRHAHRLLDAALERLLPLAESVRVPLAIEPVNPACAESWSILTSLEQSMELLRRYDTPWLQLALDTYHFPLGHFPLGRGASDLLAEIAPRLAVVHLADLASPHCPDQERCPLGEGVAPLGEIVGVLLENGYGGYFDVELSGSAIETSDYERLLHDTRRAFGEIADPENTGSEQTAAAPSAMGG